jgi:ubiquinone/menaquinone biosynthesis C-methylase UbiE
VNYERLYEYRFRLVDQRARELVWREIARFIYEELGNPETILDPAAGRGEFVGSVPSRERWAIDRIPRDGADGTIRWVVGDVLEAELPPSYFDAIFVSNFLEHLATQETVALFLAKMRRTLRPGGRIAVVGPNFKYCARDYFDFADHVLPLTHKAVIEHLHAAEYHILSAESRFLPYSFTGRLPASPGLARAYLRFKPAWRLLGRQFLVVAHRG